MRSLCPHDPVSVRCCFKRYPCNLDTFPGLCQDRTQAACGVGGQGYHSGLCPGGDNIQCCLEKTIVDTTIGYVRQVHDLALDYRKTGRGKRPANQLVMEWMRHLKYAGLKSGWLTLLGSLDEEWLRYARSHGLGAFPNDGKFADPHYCGQQVETDHLFATMNAVFLKPPLAYPFINRSDFGGWGGDLSTLYAEWYLAGRPSATWVRDRVRGNAGTFKLLDAIEDADGFNMAMTLRASPSRAIHDVLADYYKPAGSYRSRFSKFFGTRFGGSEEHARVLAHEMLTAPGNISPAEEEHGTLNLLRTAAVESVRLRALVPQPKTLPFVQLQPFCNGFADGLVKLAKDKGKDC